MQYKEVELDGSGLAELLKAVLVKDASFRFKVGGNSMRPFIKDGDIITVSRLNSAAPGIGDIVAFYGSKADRLVVHRVINKKIENNNLYFLTKGDNASCCAPETSSLKNILGRVTKIERDGKRICIGIGPERFLIAFLSRYNLSPLFFRAWRILPQPIRDLAP